VDASVVGGMVFVCAFVGALLGMGLRNALPERYFDAESRDTVKVGVGLIATMTALVLGLVTASAKGAFDEASTSVRQSATQILVLDRVLARYGPETGEIRQGMRRAVGTRIETIWPSDSSDPVSLDPLRMSGTEALADAIRGLTPHDETQKALQSKAMDIAEDLLQARWLFVAGPGESVPVPFLAVLVSWLTLTFVSFGLFAPRNGMVVTVLLVCALSVGSAVFLVLEMDGPFDGLLKVSGDSMRSAHARLAQ
jgi:hypothetical protein